MNKKIASLALAAAALGGTAALVPVVASAQDDPPTEESAAAEQAPFLTEALQPLLDDGTLDQSQFDAVVVALQDARPEHGARHGGGKSFDTLTGVLGVEEEALREALMAGQSIADIATENGVPVQDVIDALVAKANARIDEAVAEGRIDAATADEKRAELEAKITARVNGEVPEGARGFGPRGFGPPADDADTGT